MRRKFYSLVLIAAGLLIGTNVWANLPQRPTPTMEPKAPEGVEMPEHEIPEHPALIVKMESPRLGEALPVNSSIPLSKAPKKAAMEDLLATVYHGGVKIKDYPYSTDGLTALQTEMQDGDSIVLMTNLGSMNITKNVVLDLNNNYFYSSNWYELYVVTSGKVKIINGDIYSATSNASCGIYIGSGDVTLDNIYMSSSYTPNYGIYSVSGNVTINNSTIVGSYSLYMSGNNSTICRNSYLSGVSYIGSTTTNFEDCTSGELDIYGGTISIEDCALSGAIWIVAADEVKIQGCTSTSYIYTGTDATSADVTITDCSFTMLKPNAGTISVTDCQLSSQIYLPAGSTANVTVDGENTEVLNNTVYIESGTCTLKNGQYKYVYVENGEVNISGGKISRNDFWATIRLEGASTLNISGGDFYNGNSSDNTSSVLYAGGASTINISGGVFKALNYIVYTSSGTYNITGGKYDKPNGSIFYAYNSGKINVKGGWYPSNNVTDLGVALQEGYSFSKPEDGWYEVISAVAECEGIGYKSITKALQDEDIAENATITMIQNSTEDIVCGKKVILNMDNYKITGNLSTENGGEIHVYGSTISSITSITTGSNVKLYGGTYPFNPDAFKAEGYGVRDNENGTWTIGHDVCKIGETRYWTLSEAFAAVAENTPTTITMIDDAMTDESLTVNKNYDITLDLNGHRVSYSTRHTGTTALINNFGTLTIKDSQDTEKNGTGGGELTCAAAGFDQRLSPGYANNNIMTQGHLIVESGKITTQGAGLAMYAIDIQTENAAAGDYVVEIHGGLIESTGTSTAIRMYLESDGTKDTKLIIDGGIITSIWVQESDARAKGYLSVKNATITNNLTASWTGYGFAKNLTVILDNITIEDNNFFSGIDYSNRSEGDSTFSCNNVRIRTYWLAYPFKHLTNGQFQFKKDKVYYGYVYWNEEAQTKYTEENGWSIDKCMRYQTELTQYRSIYMTAECHFREFVKNIMDGYGLVCIDEENKWYEIRPTSGTTDSQDVEGHDGELGNPWHQDKTWDLTEKDVVPVETTPVLIDHNVYVEKDAKAEAASIIVKPEQTLTVKEGATLVVGNGGIVFNNEDGKTPGKIVIEPGATLLDGANGIISEDTKNVVIQASETAQGTFLFDPEVSLNTHPFGTVELISRSGLRKYPNDQLVNYWHRFASPVMELKEENFTNDWDTYSATTELQIAAGTYFQTQIFQWSSSLYNWERIDKKENYCDSIVPFQGYTMLNNCTWDNTHKGGVTYTFRGNLVGNHNDDLTFLSKGYNYFGNSYTAPINIKELLAAVDNDDINRTIYIWDAELQVFRGWSFEQLLYVDDETTPASVPSMQTFVMQLLEGNSATSHIDYVNAIWNPVVSAVKTVQAPKRAKQQVLDATLKINITAANGEKDAVVMMKDARYSNELDNGADTEKYMNEGSINMYAHADFANVSTLADAEIEGTMLSISSNDETDYLMTFSCVSGDQYAIKDHVTGTVVTISNGDSYAFSTKANSTAENRFEIIALRKMPTDMEHVKVNAAVKGIYSITGQYIGQSHDWFRLPAGVYVMDGNKVVK